MEQLIDSIRVSLLWTLADPAMLGDGTALLGTGQRYAAAMAAARATPSGQGYVAPWHKVGGFSRLWAYYLGSDYATAPDQRSWDRLVPMRRRRVLRPEGVNEPRLSLYVWPHFVAAVLDIEVETGGLPRDQAVRLAIARATTEEHRFAPGPGDPDRPVVEGDAGEVLRRHAAWQLEAAGGDPDRAVPRDRPFSVTTVLCGAGGAEVPERSEPTWRAVHGLACLNPRWANLSLHPAGEHRITARSDPGDDGGLYGVPRGRVVWLPKRFLQVDPQAQDPALLWYHRNLTGLTLQVEAHLALATWAAGRLGRGQLAFEAGELVRHAAQTLMRLYTGDRQHTYRSASARRQIEDGDITLVRAVCDHFGVLPPVPPVPLA